MKFTKKVFLSCLFAFSGLFFAAAQDVSVAFGKTEIALNEYFTITIQVKNDRLKKYSGFPDIEGFVKRGTSSSTSTNFVNGRMSSTQSITQNYQPTAQGDYEIAPFTITINGKEIKSKGATITVGEAIQRQSRRRRDPFDSFFGRSNEPTEFVDVDAEAFLAITTDKSEVYVGEGFTATLAFYVAETNKAEMRFHDLANQITEIVKKVKPSNCWEENFAIDQIVGEQVKINNKRYTQYKIHQSTFYPLNTLDVEFPSIGLEMIKYKVAKNPSFFGRNREEDFETFYSREKEIKVVDLPPHPLKDVVSVGNFRLDEQISVRDKASTGESFNYDFIIKGEGNISSVEPPLMPETRDFDFYDPNVLQNINRADGRVTGSKTFSYYVIPNEPGDYPLSNYFSWVFFNTNKDGYDTLKSEYVLRVGGESRRNLAIASTDLGDFYNKIDWADNKLTPTESESWIVVFLNILIGLILIGTLYLLIKKPT